MAGAAAAATGLQRRRWLAAAAGMPLSGGLFGCATAALSGKQPLVRPPRLKAGDTVGLFAPSGAASEAQLARGRDNLQSLGFRVRVPRHILARHGHLAGTVEQRVDDIHALWLDPEVKALWALRGGSGAAALLPHLDYSALRRHPKIVIGYSDLTALHLALWRQAGLASFHGPVATSTFTPFTWAALQATLMSPQRETVLSLSAEHRARAEAGGPTSPFQARTLRAGVAEGRLVGGNLSVLAALIGTPYAPQLRDALLFLEDVGEAPYRIDRMLTQLDQALDLPRSAGWIAGVFDRCDIPPGDLSLSLDEVLAAHGTAAGVPAVAGWSFGHVRDQWTLPLGVRARLDTAAGTLTLLEPAVT
jgi:muramoyltetrapeptide carboxypeptidase